MPPIDYTIPGQFKGIQIESPINRMAAIEQLENARQQQQMNALRMQEQALKAQETQETSRQRNALAAYLANPKKPTDPLELEAGVRGVAPLLADKFVEDQLRRADLGIRTEEHRAKIDANKLLRDQRAAELTKEQFQDAVSDLISYDTVDQVKTALAQKVTAKQITQAQADQVTARLPRDNAGIPAWQIATMRNLLTPKERYAEIKARQDAKYNAYKNSEIFNGRVPLSQEDFERQTPTAAPTTVDTTAPAAVPAIAPAPASAAVDTAAPAEVTTMPDGTKTFSGVTKVASKQGVEYLDVTAQRLLQLSATAETDREAAAYRAAADKIQAAHVKFLEDQEKRKEFSPEYRDVFLARKKVQELRKLPPTPDVLEEIGDALDLIKTSKQGKGTKVNVGVKLPPQEEALEVELGKGQAKQILENKTKAEDARDMLDTVGIGRGILKSGAITGAGADFFVGLNQALKTAGVDFGYADASANSQAYTANMAQNVGKLIKLFGAGTGLSNADRDYAEKMAGGKIALDRTALEKILDIQERAARNVIKRHNKNVQGIKSKTDLRVEIDEEPAATTPRAPAVGTVQDGYKFNGGNPADAKNWTKVK